MTSFQTISRMLPEIILVATATWIYLDGAFVPNRSRGWSWFAFVGLFFSGVCLYNQGLPSIEASTGAISIDFFSQAVRWVVLSFGLFYVILSTEPSSTGHSAEYLGSLLMIFAGLMIVGMANDLVLMYLALELISIPTYIVLYLGRKRPAADQKPEPPAQDHDPAEATLKYFFLSIFSSALLLYGFSFLYGVAHSTSLSDLHQVLSMPDGEPVISMLALSRIGLVLVIVGLAFKLAAVPFHFYAPDVFQGTTHQNAGLLAVVPKIAAIVALVRIGVVAMPGLEHYGWHITMAMAMLTMTLGNVMALWQNNVRRLLAYSSIAHAGYMLIGLAVGFAVVGGASSGSAMMIGADGVGAALFYLVVYALATIGTFALLTYLGCRGRQIDTVEQLAGLSKKHPGIAAALAIFMFSLAGIPPLAGFWGKLALFVGALNVDSASGAQTSAMRTWFVALAIVGVLNAAIAAAYYLRIVAVAYFRPIVTTPKAQGGANAWIVMTVCAVLVVGAGIYPRPFLDGANMASQAAVNKRTNTIKPSAPEYGREHRPKSDS